MSELTIAERIAEIRLAWAYGEEDETRIYYIAENYLTAIEEYIAKLTQELAVNEKKWVRHVADILLRSIKDVLIRLSVINNPVPTTSNNKLVKN